MNKIQARIPSGFIEYSPAEQIEFNRLRDIIQKSYEKYGFAPIETPDVELSEVLLAKGGGETDQQIYRFERGKNDLSLRFDLTVPLARYTAQHEGELVFPFRRYQIGRVHRAERAQAGRFREFYQCDIDIIGSDNPKIDGEFPVVINDIFSQFNFGEFTIRVNNRKILNGFFESLGLSENSKEILRIIDKIEKISSDELKSELSSSGLSDDQINSLLSFVSITGSNSEIIEKLKQLNNTSGLFKNGIEQLETLLQTALSMKVPESRLVIDLKIARGLDYYTGSVYETLLNDHPQIGSVCSGGRYDNLADSYTNTKLPGVGISIGLTRLFYQLLEANIITPTRQTPSNIIVIPISEEHLDYSIEVVSRLRESGIPTILHSTSDPYKKKIHYADRLGVKFTVSIGDYERDNNKVSIKDMTSGSVQVVDLDQVAQTVSSLLNY